MKLSGGTSSHVGNVREVNQDRAHFCESLTAVADGMGGHKGGEIAAEVAVLGFQGITGQVEPEELADLVSDANNAIFDRAIDPDLRGMGTTLVVLALQSDESQVVIANVGDSRAYLFRGKELTQITIDHSLVEDLVRTGEITKEEALHHPQRNIVTRALGIAPRVEPDLFPVSIELGDRFLLCSDGLFNEVSEERIAEYLQTSDPVETAELLVQAAIGEAGRDNVTVSVVDVVAGNPSKQTAASATETETDLDPLTDEIEQSGGQVPEEDPTLKLGVESPSVESATTTPLPVVDEIVNPAAVTQPIEEDLLAVDPTEKMEPPDVGLPVSNEGPQPGMGSLPPNEDVTATPQKEGGRLGRLLMKLGAVVIFFGLFAFLAAGYFGVNWYGTSQWYVGEKDGNVAIFQGRDGGFLWVNPELVDTRSDLQVAKLDEASMQVVERRATASSLEEANGIVDGLSEESESEPELDESDELSDSPDTSLPPSSSSVPPEPPVGQEADPAVPGAQEPVPDPTPPQLDDNRQDTPPQAQATLKLVTD